MATPEKGVKTKVKRVLAKHGMYFFMPATHGYGSSGVPDIVGCMGGLFVGVECKANGNRPTALQLKNLMAIVAAGGLAVAVDETGLDDLDHLLTQHKNGIHNCNGVYKLLARPDETQGRETES